MDKRQEYRKRRRKRLAEALPSDRKLTAGLATALESMEERVEELEVLKRETNTFYSSHPSEIVFCRINGDERALLVKYGSTHSYLTNLSRAGIEYEAEVYRRILYPHRISAPPLRGILEQEGNEITWLIIEYLTKCVRLDNLTTAIVTAAAWLGKLHAYAENGRFKDSFSFLKVYDFDFYDYWLRGAARRIAPLDTKYPWIPDLVETTRGLLADLSSKPRVFIHGEFYPHNILVQDGEIYPVDWETAAFGLAEIDLVSLVDGWPEEVIEMCTRAYGFARWGDAFRPEFERSLLFADLYWNVRWLSGIGKRNRGAFDPSKRSGLPPRINRLRTICNLLSRSSQARV